MTIVNAINSNATGYIDNAIPVAPNDLATKSYADLISAGFVFKQIVAAATTANLTAVYNNGAAGVGATLTNSGVQAAFAIDGYSASLNDRILIKNQSAALQNGIYSVTTVGNGSTNWVLTRTTDYDQTTQIVPGSLVPVQNGTSQSGTFWVEQATVNTIGTDPIVFTQFGATNGVETINSQAAVGNNFNLTDGGTGAITFASSPGQITASVSVDGTTITINGSDQLVATAANIAWSDVGTSSTVTSNSGSFVTAAVLLMLPASPNNGDIVQFYNQSGSPFAVEANGSQIIQVDSSQSSLGGNVTCYQLGDSITLVYRSTNTCWCATAFVGNWLIS